MFEQVNDVGKDVQKLQFGTTQTQQTYLGSRISVPLIRSSTWHDLCKMCQSLTSSLITLDLP